MNTTEKVNKIIGSKKVQNAFYNLFDRWEDEKGVEDINDYGNVLFKTFPSVGAELVESTSKPFGVKFKIDNKVYHLYVAITGEYLVLRCKMV